MDAADFVAYAAGSSVLMGTLTLAVRQGIESAAVWSRARSAKIKAEAAQDEAGAAAVKHAVERLGVLETRVAELERGIDERDDRIRHLEGQNAVQQQQIDAAKRAQKQAEDLQTGLQRELSLLRNDVAAGYTNPHKPAGQTALPTPMLPPRGTWKEPGTGG